MTRVSAAVIATAAAAAGTCAGIEASAAADAAVRAEVVVAGEGHTLDVRRIRIVDSLRAGASYRLPPIGIRNHRRVPTAYRLVVSPGAARRWLRFVAAGVPIDAGRTRAIGLRLELPDDAAPGAYALVLGVRPGRTERARLAFRVERAEAGRWGRQATSRVMWIVPALAGAALIVVKARVGG